MLVGDRRRDSHFPLRSSLLLHEVGTDLLKDHTSSGTNPAGLGKETEIMLSSVSVWRNSGVLW